MTTHRLFFLIFILLIGTNVQSQNEETYCERIDKQLDTIDNQDRKIDFLKEVYAKADIICKTDILIAMGFIYGLQKENDSAFYYYDSAIGLAKSIKSDELKSNELLANVYSKKAQLLSEIKKYDEARALLKKSRKLLEDDPNNMGWYAYYATYSTISDNSTELEKALIYSDSALQFSKKTNNIADIPNDYHNKGVYLIRLSRYKEASENLLLALELKEKQKNPSQLAATYFVLGRAYMEWGQTEIAIRYLKKAIARGREEGDDHIRLLSYSKITQAQRELKHYKTALKYTDSTEIMALKLNDNSQLAAAYVEKGLLYLNHLKDDDQAEVYFLKGYKEAQIGDNNITLYPSLQSVIEFYLNKKEPEKAEKYFYHFKDVMQRLGGLRYLQEYNKTYSAYYEQIGKTDSAMKYLKKYYIIKDSIANTTVKTQVADLEKKYDTKTKELSIVKLTKEKEEQEIVAQEAKTKQFISFLVAGFLLVMLAIGFWAFKKLRKQQKELTSTNQVKNRLFSIIAHDLRGMIIPFQRSGKILKHHIEKGNYDRTIELSKALEQNSESLSNMLDNLLNWSLQQMDGYKINSERISVKEELDVIIAMYEQQALFKKTKIDLIYEKDLWINFDRGAFNVIFRNLIGNALKYTEEGNIRIEFNNKFDVFLCAITDTGIGMSQDKVKNLFTLETNTSTTGTQGEKGTGLGLNLVYRFIKMHKGHIEASSEKRMGTRFEMKIPSIILNEKEEKDAKIASA